MSDYEPLTDEMMRDLDADEMRVQGEIERANEAAVMCVELAQDAEADAVEEALCATTMRRP